MVRSIATACILAALAGSAVADPADCSGLAQARAQARATAAPLHYEVADLDGAKARALEAEQLVPAAVQSDHLTVVANPKTGRSAALLNNGPSCAFETVVAVLPKPFDTPMAAVLDVLRMPR